MTAFSVAAKAAAGGLTGVPISAAKVEEEAAEGLVVSFSLSVVIFGRGRMAVFIVEAGLAGGADEVGPPRALEDAVAEAYEPR